MKKEWSIAILCIVALAAGASVAWFSSVRAKTVLKNGAAIVVQSWRDAFSRGDDGSLAAEIDFGGENPATDTASIVDSSIEAADTSPFPQNISTTLSNVSSKAHLKMRASSSINIGNTVASASVAMLPAPSSSVKRSASAPPLYCPFPGAAPPSSRKIIFNEIAWMGSVPAAGESSIKASGREWIELKNNSGSDLDLSRWQLIDPAGTIKIIFDGGEKIPAGGFYLLARGEDAIPVAAAKIYSGALSNAGDALALFDPACGVSDFLDARSGWPGGENGTKQTLERDVNTLGWHTSAQPGGTPGAVNSLLPPRPSVSPHISIAPPPLPPPVAVSSTDPVASTTTTGAASSSIATTSTVAASIPSHMVIDEVQIAGASSSNDFVGLFNPTAVELDMSGWKLRKKSSTGADSSLREFPQGTVIAPNGTFAWANSAGGFGDAIGANATSSATLAAANSVALFDAKGTIVDAVAWGSGTNQYVEGSPYPTDPEGNQTLKRKCENGMIIDTDNNRDDFTM